VLPGQIAADTSETGTVREDTAGKLDLAFEDIAATTGTPRGVFPVFHQKNSNRFKEVLKFVKRVR
jgi:hypothetical protein